jgi:hypothetical protein
MGPRVREGDELRRGCPRREGGELTRGLPSIPAGDGGRGALLELSACALLHLV